MKQLELKITPLTLSKYTFGSTPAAIYLANVLGELGSSSLVRKVGSSLTKARTLLKELENSNAAGTLSNHHVSAIVHMLRTTTSVDFGNKIVNGLVSNIIIGEMKSLARRTAQARILEQNQQRIYGRENRPYKLPIRVPNSDVVIALRSCEGVELQPIKCKQMKEDITAKSLIQKSCTKLDRKKKINTLY